MREQQNFIINWEKYTKSGLTFAVYITLQLIFEDKFESIDESTRFELLEHLETIEDFTGILYTNLNRVQAGHTKKLELSTRSLKLFNKNAVEAWIEEWRSLWPKGKKDGKYPWKGSKSGCLAKMLKLVKVTKASKEQVFEATKRYIRRFSPTYQGMRIAHYFIEKDNISDLATELENLDESEYQSRVVGK